VIRVLFFASVRDRLGVDQLAIEEVPSTVEELRTGLAARDPDWEEVLGAGQRVLVAVNQAMAGPQTPLHDGDEVGFFPPVTGG
jgi:molybdopterin synthase sulfur carrier subunit